MKGKQPQNSNENAPDAQNAPEMWYLAPEMAYSYAIHAKLTHGSKNSSKEAPKIASFQYKTRPNYDHKYGNNSLQKYGKREELQSKWYLQCLNQKNQFYKIEEGPKTCIFTVDEIL